MYFSHSNSPRLVAYRNSLKPPEAPKPPLPYIEGYELTISQHTAPPPIGGGYGEIPKPDPKLFRGASQLDWILSNPPAEGSISSTATKVVTITRILRTGPDQGAQVIIVRNEDGKELVAKIYDPLYYEYWVYDEFIDDPPFMQVDVATAADVDYRTEAATYEALRGSVFEGDATPRYSGSWSFSLRVEGHAERTTRMIRMILIEVIPGICMMRFDASTLTQKEREHTMKRILEIDADLSAAGICHLDVAPRNVMLCLSSSEQDPGTQTIARIVFIDFNQSHIWHLLPKKYGPLLPYSPIHQWWCCLSEFADAGWLPRGHECEEWLWSTFEGDQRYLPVTRDPRYTNGRPAVPQVESSEGSPRSTPDGSVKSFGSTSSKSSADEVDTPKDDGPMHDGSVKEDCKSENNAKFGLQTVDGKKKDTLVPSLANNEGKSEDTLTPAPIVQDNITNHLVHATENGHADDNKDDGVVHKNMVDSVHSQDEAAHKDEHADKDICQARFGNGLESGSVVKKRRVEE